MCSNADAHLKGDKFMVKKLRCEVDGKDWVLAESGVHYVEICMHSGELGGITNIFLSPKSAKKLRKQIKAALAEIEGEPEEDIVEEKEEPAYIPHVGEVVEVYRNTSYHGFSVGQKVRVTEAGNGLRGCHARALDTEGRDWAVTRDIRPIQNWKPKEGEKVLIVDSTYVPSDTTRSWAGNFGIIGASAGDVVQVYNEDKSDWFRFHASDLRPAE